MNEKKRSRKERMTINTENSLNTYEHTYMLQDITGTADVRSMAHFYQIRFYGSYESSTQTSK